MNTEIREQKTTRAVETEPRLSPAKSHPLVKENQTAPSTRKGNMS